MEESNELEFHHQRDVIEWGGDKAIQSMAPHAKYFQRNRVSLNVFAVH